MKNVPKEIQQKMVDPGKSRFAIMALKNLLTFSLTELPCHRIEIKKFCGTSFRWERVSPRFEAELR